jgi:hypothetical protein
MSIIKLPGMTFRLEVRVSRGLPAKAAGKCSAASRARTCSWPYLRRSVPAGRQERQVAGHRQAGLQRAGQAGKQANSRPEKKASRQAGSNYDMRVHAHPCVCRAARQRVLPALLSSRGLPAPGAASSSWPAAAARQSTSEGRNSGAHWGVGSWPSLSSFYFMSAHGMSKASILSCTRTTAVLCTQPCATAHVAGQLAGWLAACPLPL